MREGDEVPIDQTWATARSADAIAKKGVTGVKETKENATKEQATEIGTPGNAVAANAMSGDPMTNGASVTSSVAAQKLELQKLAVRRIVRSDGENDLLIAMYLGVPRVLRVTCDGVDLDRHHVAPVTGRGVFHSARVPRSSTEDHEISTAGLGGSVEGLPVGRVVVRASRTPNASSIARFGLMRMTMAS